MSLFFRLRPGLVAAAMGVFALAVQAQTVPTTPPSTPPPGSVPQSEELRQRALPAKPDAASVPEAPVPRELGKPSEELTLDVSAYRVDDSAPAELRAALPALTQRFTGTGRSYEDLVNAAAAVTRYLQRELGYYLGYAYLPEQTPVNGVIRIAVLEGRLDEVILNWPDKMSVNRSVVEAYLARLKPGEILRVREVERIVFLVNDLRGLTARFEVKAGRTPGTASLVVTAQPEERFAARVEVDSLGSRYSGVLRGSVQGTMASPAGRGDGLVVNALSSFTRGLEFVLGGYTLPVGSDGLKVGVSASYVHYKLDPDLLEHTDLSGDATAITMYGLYPVVRSRNLNLFGLVSVDAKRYNDRLFGFAQKKTSNDLQLSVSGDARDDLLTGGVNTFELVALRGKLKSPQVGAENENPADFTLTRFSASRLQNLISNRLLLLTTLKGQYALDNLDNTEQFQLGGPDRVRAFGPGEGTGDTGLVASIELRLLPPEQWLGRLSREFVFSTFYDIGTIRFRHKPTLLDTQQEGFVNRSTLSGFGFGAVWDRPKDFSMRLSLAWAISGKAVNDELKKPRIYFIANKSF
ncbi:MAG: ShlB/FhaC/HecB family hemolysin secretion/activation protein [Caldimonas sp.]